MNFQCPYDDHPLSDTAQRISSCEQFHLLVFQCSACGSWNRSFAIYCTQCGELLAKPENWSMVGKNAQHRPMLDETTTLPSDYGFCNAPIPLTDEPPASDSMPDAPLPCMLTADSFLIFPNPYTKCLQIHNIADQKNPKILEDIPIQLDLGLAQTPVFWGGHLYYARPGGIFSTSLIDGYTSALRGDAAITPVRGCAPICISRHLAPGECPLIVFGLSTSILLYSPVQEASLREIPCEIGHPDRLRSPVYFYGHIIFTTEYGKLLDLDLSTLELRQYDSQGQFYFSAPVVANEQICFEAVDNTGIRYIGRYYPNGGLPVYQPLIAEESRGVERYLDYPAEFLMASPLSDGTRLILSDRFGEELYFYTVAPYPHDGGTQLHRLPSNAPGQMTSPRSILVQGSIYATSQHGITTLANNISSTQQLLVEGQRDYPIASPICYGDKLFVLCEKNVFCIQIR